MNKINKKLVMTILALLPMLQSEAQTFDNHYTRSLNDEMGRIEKRFNVKFKYNVDTVGLKLPYADFRVRAYSIEETLDNICKYFDFNWWNQGKGVYKIKPY